MSEPSFVDLISLIISAHIASRQYVCVYACMCVCVYVCMHLYLSVFHSLNSFVQHVLFCPVCRLTTIMKQPMKANVESMSPRGMQARSGTASPSQALTNYARSRTIICGGSPQIPHATTISHWFRQWWSAQAEHVAKSPTISDWLPPHPPPHHCFRCGGAGPGWPCFVAWRGQPGPAMFRK